MKKLAIAVLAFLLAAPGATGQTEQGRFLLGPADLLGIMGGKWFWERSEDDLAFLQRDVELSVVVGYCPADNLVVGIAPSYRLRMTDIIDSDDMRRTRDIGGAVFARYYLGSRKFRPYSQAGLGFFGRRHSEVRGSATYEDKDGYVRYDLSAGMAYFIADRVSLDLSLQYSRAYVEFEADPIYAQGQFTSEGFTEQRLRMMLTIFVHLGP